MKMLRASLVVLALACAAAPFAFAQWQWVDASGRKVFSDQPPPPGTPPDKILKRPANRPAEAEPTAAASAPAAPAAAAPRVTGRDKELEDKKKAVAAAEAEKRKAQDQEAASAKVENCQRAKEAKRTLESNVRLSQTNASGERELMDDATRASEAHKMDSIIARDCGR